MREMRALLALEGDAEGSKAMEIEMVKDLQKPGKPVGGKWRKKNETNKNHAEHIGYIFFTYIYMDCACSFDITLM